jgi:hypothetical protein
MEPARSNNIGGGSGGGAAIVQVVATPAGNPTGNGCGECYTATCCCGCDLKTGSLILVILGLIFNVISMITSITNGDYVSMAYAIVWSLIFAAGLYGCVTESAVTTKAVAMIMLVAFVLSCIFSVVYIVILAASGILIVALIFVVPILVIGLFIQYYTFLILNSYSRDLKTLQNGGNVVAIVPMGNVGPKSPGAPPKYPANAEQMA